MKNLLLIGIILTVLFVCSCSSLNPLKTKKYVHFETNKGEFVVGLYEGTPNHKRNFINKCKTGIYDSCLVYSAKPNTVLKVGLKANVNEEYVLRQNFSQGKTIKAETNKKLINKRGAIGMLHWDNALNKNIQSDEKLFYVVEGQKYSEKLKQKYEMFQNGKLVKEYMYNNFLERSENRSLKDSLFFYENHHKTTEYRNLYATIADSVRQIMKTEKIDRFSIPETEAKIYGKNGGVPELDGKYTVFGEIVWNQDIVNEIATKALGQNFKPRNDIYFFKSNVMNKRQFKKFLKSKK